MEKHQNLFPTKHHINGTFFLLLPLCHLRFLCLSSWVVVILLYAKSVLISSQPICLCVIMDFLVSNIRLLIKECIYVSGRNYLLLVFLHLHWNFLCQIGTCSLMPLQMVAIPISALLVRIQGCPLCKDKQTNGEMRGQFCWSAWFIACLVLDAVEALLGCEKTVIEFRKAILQNTAW